MTISTLSRWRLLCGTAVVLGGAPLVSALAGLIAAPSASAVTLGPGLAGFQAHAAAQSAGGLLLLGDDAAAVRQLTSQLGEQHFFVVGVVPAHSHQIAQAVGWVQAHPQARALRIAVIGLGSHTGSALRLAHSDARVGAVVIADERQLGPQAQADFRRLRQGGVPTLIEHGMTDRAAPLRFLASALAQ